MKTHALARAGGLRWPPREFSYDGKIMVVYLPNDGLAAVAAAPPTVQAALAQAFMAADVYSPFEDLLLAKPLRRALRLGQGAGD